MQISVVALLTSTLVWVVFLTHFFSSVMRSRWCFHSCFGPYLFWSEGDIFKDYNGLFRNTFSLRPQLLGEHYGGLFVGALIWLKLDDWAGEKRWAYPLALLLVALFACLPFAGVVGIIFGFGLCLVALVVLVWPQLAQKQITLPQLPISLPELPVGDKFKQWLGYWTFGSLVLAVGNNVAHIARNEFHGGWCPHRCIGPYLSWPYSSRDWFKDVNLQGWGSVFSLDINRLMELWAPLILVLLILSQTRYRAIGLLVLAVFGSFGYGGNVGIVLGMNLVVLAAVHLLVDVPNTRPKGWWGSASEPLL
ncbi:hypothetical protein BASA81_015867 [Batrachochytrium salamandrivorans]|nr:hypothetical protein BASA81_015867 [Batrachochytrium salamandrivorans]